MARASEFDDSGGLGLLLHAAHPATDVQDERAPPPTRASRQRGHTNSPEEVTGSLEPVTGLDQENLDTQDTQQGGEHLDAGPALDSLDPLKLAAARGITKSNPVTIHSIAQLKPALTELRHMICPCEGAGLSVLCSRVTRLKVSQSDGHQAASVSVSSKENLLLVLTCQAKVTYLFRRAAG